jgi:hypothetical protein
MLAKLKAWLGVRRQRKLERTAKDYTHLSAQDQQVQDAHKGGPHP